MRIILITTVCVFLMAFVLHKPPAKCYGPFRDWYLQHHSELTVSSENAGIISNMRYLPNEVTICQELLTMDNVSSKKIRELYRRYDAYEEYTLTLSEPYSNDFLLGQSEDREDYQQKQFYLIESVGNDFVLIRDSDTLRPQSCHFENNYGTAPILTVHLTFPKAESTPKNTWKLLYDDQLFGLGLTEFSYNHLTHIRIPKIK